MGILANIFPTPIVAQSTNRDPRNNLWFEDLALPTLSGIRINADTALTLSVVWACIRILSSSIASLPCIMYRRLADDGKERDRSHPLYDILRWQPNDWQTAYEFWEMMVGHAALRGRGLAQIVPGLRGSVDQLIPIHPDRVLEVQRLEDGTLRHKISMPFGPAVFLLQDEVFDLRMFTVDGINPCSIIKLARESMGLTKGMEEHSAAFYGNQSVPRGALISDHKIDKEAANELRVQWEEQHQGTKNAHRVAVLANGLKWQQMGMTAEDSQFLQSKQFQLDEVSRWFGVQPHLVANLLRSTNNNIEAQGQEFVTFTLRSWLTRIEQAIRRDLIVAKRTFFAEFLVDALLRGDFKTRTEGYSKLISAGVMTRNEARQLENMNKLPGLDKPLIPMNMTVVNEDGTIDDTGSSDNGGFGAKALPPPAEPDGLGAKALEVSAREAAQRIASAETRELEKRADKAEADPERFAVWVNKYCDHHHEYVATALKPLRLSNSMVDAIVLSFRTDLSCGDPLEYLAFCKTGRADLIYKIIKGELFA